MIMPTLGISRKRASPGGKKSGGRAVHQNAAAGPAACSSGSRSEFYASELIQRRRPGTARPSVNSRGSRGGGLLEAGASVTRSTTRQTPASPLFTGTAEHRPENSRLGGAVTDSIEAVVTTIRAAFVFGSVAKATDRSASDIDLMIISDRPPTPTCLAPWLETCVTKTLGRPVNPTVLTAAEFSKRNRQECIRQARIRAAEGLDNRGGG